MASSLQKSNNTTFKLNSSKSDLQIGLDPCIEHFQSNNWCTQLGTGKIVGPKQTFLDHSKIFLNEIKGDPYWKCCSGHNGVGFTTKK